jgi:hypothetical protein
MKAQIPADAKGTYTIGIEARRGITLNPGTTKEIAGEYGAINKEVIGLLTVDGKGIADDMRAKGIEAGRFQVEGKAFRIAQLAEQLFKGFFGEHRVRRELSLCLRHGGHGRHRGSSGN